MKSESWAALVGVPKEAHAIVVIDQAAEWLAGRLGVRREAAGAWLLDELSLGEGAVRAFFASEARPSAEERASLGRSLLSLRVTFQVAAGDPERWDRRLEVRIRSQGGPARFTATARFERAALPEGLAGSDHATFELFPAPAHAAPRATPFD